MKTDGRKKTRGPKFDDRVAAELLLKANKKEVDFMDFPFFKECADVMNLRCGIHKLSQRKHVLDVLEKSPLFQKEIRCYKVKAQHVWEKDREVLGRAFVLKDALNNSL